MLRRWAACFALGITLAMLSGCGDDDTSPTPDRAVSLDSGPTSDGAPAPDSAPAADLVGADSASATSLANDVVPIVAAQCGFCHTRTSSPAPNAVRNNVYFETKDDLLSLVGTFIIAGEATNSGLVKIMKQELGVGAGNTLMPPPASGRPAMSSEDIAVVEAWINDGALDN